MISGNSTYWYSRPSNAATINVRWSETSLNEVNNLSLMQIVGELKRSSGTTTGTFAGTLYVIDADTNDLIYQSAFSTKKTWGTTYQDIFNKSGISIPHNDNGAKNIKIYIEMTQGGTTLAGDYYFSNSPIALTSIPRRSKINNATFNIEGSTTLDITKYVEDYYHYLTVYTLNETGTEYVLILNRLYASNGDSITLSEDELNDYYDQNINRASTSIKLVLETFSDWEFTDYIGKDEKILTYNIANDPPTFSSFDIDDNNTTTLALTGNSAKIIKGYSNCIISNVVVEAKKNANIKNLSINGVLYTYVDEGTYDIGILTSRTVSIYAIDTRGFSSLLSNIIDELNWVEYFKLEKLSQEWLRTNNIDKETTIKFSGKVFGGNFGSISNSILTSYRYKKSDSSTWSTGTTIIVPEISSSVFNFDNFIKGDTDAGFTVDDSFNVEITITDKLSQVVYEYLVNSGSPADAVYKNCIAVGGAYNETLGGRLQLLGKYKCSEENSNLKIKNTPINIISNLTTNTEGVGLLDAYQGKVLNDKLNLSSITAYQNANNSATVGQYNILEANLNTIQLQRGTKLELNGKYIKNVSSEDILVEISGVMNTQLATQTKCTTSVIITNSSGTTITTLTNVFNTHIANPYATSITPIRYVLPAGYQVKLALQNQESSRALLIYGRSGELATYLTVAEVI